MIYIKTKKEIDFIRESCRLVSKTLELLKKYIKPGITTKEIDLIAEDFLLSHNAKPAFKGYEQGNGIPFPASVCISVDEEVVHGIPDKRVLREGEIVSLDFGVILNGYFGDSATTVPVGQISEEKKKLLEITEKSLYIGIEEAKVGNKVHDISFAIQNFVEKNGYSIVRELTGHGVGRFLHEDPSIPNYGKKGTGPKLKNGMTLAIEPMVNMGKKDVIIGYDGWTVITRDGLPAAHFEHTILVNDGKPEILTIN